MRVHAAPSGIHAAAPTSLPSIETLGILVLVLASALVVLLLVRRLYQRRKGGIR